MMKTSLRLVLVLCSFFVACAHPPIVVTGAPISLRGAAANEQAAVSFQNEEVGKWLGTNTSVGAFDAISEYADENYYMEVDFSKCVGKELRMRIEKCVDEECLVESLSRVMRVADETGVKKADIKNCFDPNSYFIPSFLRQSHEEKSAGIFGGLGLELYQHPKTKEIIIIGVFIGTPAEKAGIEEGDMLVGIDKIKITQESSLSEAVRHLRGRVGDPVAVFVERNGKELRFDMVRDKIQAQTVFDDAVGNVAYVKLTQFIRQITPIDFRRAIEGVQKKGFRDAVLDIRGNLGGSLDAVVCAVGLFARNPNFIVVTEKSRGVVLDTYRANDCFATQHWPVGLASNMNFVVLVDGYSASASEIMAANLQEMGIPVVGTVTYKKGTVQTEYDIPIGSRVGILHLTIAEYCTGNACRKIDGIGVRPDVEVRDSEEKSKDLKEKESDEPVKMPVFRSKRHPDPKHDIQLKRALEILQKKFLK